MANSSSPPDDRENIVDYIERRAAVLDGRRYDPKWGGEYQGDAVLLRALASDIRARLDVEDVPCHDAPLS